ncbi:MAG: hypothetical protein ACD_12C00422G0001, partial [uncultured bacterium]
RTKNDVYFFEEFKKTSKEYLSFDFKICLSRETNFLNLEQEYFIKGHINQAILSSFLTANNQIKNSFEYYICGSREVVSSIRTFLQEQEIKPENIFFEKF